MATIETASLPGLGLRPGTSRLDAGGDFDHPGSKAGGGERRLEP
jgi:hypothetical protein